MDRRRFLTTLGAGAASLTLSGAMEPALAGEDRSPAGEPEKDPNLLIIHTDQQSCWTIGAYGGTLIPTPHIDRLAREGALFENFMATSAVCTPSRGCFLTGRYPHSHGAYRNNVPLNRDEITLARLLKRRGYATGYAGKWHLDGEPKPGWVDAERSMGFDDCRFMFNRGHWKKIVDQRDGHPEVHKYKVIGDEKSYTTDWLCGKTIDFIKEKRKKPFFYMVSIPDPHTPFTVRVPYDTRFDPDDMPVPATFFQTDLPAWIGKGRKEVVAKEKRRKQEAQLRRKKAQYCGEVQCIDDGVGRILDALEETGQLDSTVIVFSTDHGEYMGEHGLFGKNNLYETAYRIPLLVRWPGRVRRGTRIRNLLGSVDFQPTLLGLLGMPASGREQGRDGAHLILGREGEWVDEAFIHHSSHKRAGIFTPQWELAYVEGSEHILFDRVNDPDQVNNLFDDPAHGDTVRELFERVVSHNREVEAPARAWLEKI